MEVENCRCMKCNNKSIHTFSTGPRGYGSKFDRYGIPIEICLCEKCSKGIRELWFEEKPTIVDGYVQNYLYEKEIVNFIEDLPKSSRDLINSRGYNFYH